MEMQDSHDLTALLYSRVKAAILEKNWAEAEKFITECFNQHGNKVQPFWFSDLSLIYRKLEKHDKADLACSNAIIKFPDRPLGYICRAENALLKKDWKLSEHLWGEVINRFPQNIHPSWRANHCLSIFHCGSADITEYAHKIIDDFSKIKNLNPNIYGNNAIKMAQAQQFRVAYMLCKTTQEKFPESVDTWRCSALVSNIRKLNLRAANEWGLATRLSKGDALIQSLYQEIMSLIKSGKYQSIISRIKTLEKIAPGHEKLFLAKLEVCIAQGHFQGALEVLKNIRSHKQFQFIPTQRASFICMNANLALDEAKKILSIEPEDPLLIKQVEDVYGQASPSNERVLEILESENQLWFKDRKRQLSELRKLKLNFLKNRNCAQFTILVKYWLTFSNNEELDKLYGLAKKMFPHSRIKHQLEQAILKGGESGDSSKKYIDSWMRFLPSSDNSIASQLNRIPYAKLHCIVVVKDESEMLPHFLSYYRNLGIDSFVVIDNDLDSNIAINTELILKYGLTIIKAPFSFSKNNHGMNWINEFIDAKKCEWLLFADVDEFLVYPNYENTKISQYIEVLENTNQSVVSAFMLDMYDESYITQSVPGDDLNKHIYFYDEYFFTRDLNPPYRFITGGIRGSGKWSNVLNKVPLIKISEGIHYTGNHSVSNCSLGPNTAALLHYKLFRDRRLFNQPTKNLIEHKRLKDRSAACIARHLDIYNRNQMMNIRNKSVQYQGSSQLLKLGYINSVDKADTSFSKNPTDNAQPNIKFIDDKKKRGLTNQVKPYDFSEYIFGGISFCTSIKNRLSQLRQTLEPNLSCLRPSDQICLVDFGSTDGLSDWIWSNFTDAINNGYLTFFEVNAPTIWNSARAKSLAHRLASGTYLFNLDADNFLTDQDMRQIIVAAQNGSPCHQWSQDWNRPQDWNDGSFGRIGLPKILYNYLGGYDEAFLPMGHQDFDLLNRIRDIGQEIVKISPPTKMAISNNINEKMAEIMNVSDPITEYHQMEQLNKMISDMKLKYEGPIRDGSYLSYKGKINGKQTLIDGYGNFYFEVN